VERPPITGGQLAQDVLDDPQTLSIHADGICIGQDVSNAGPNLAVLVRGELAGTAERSGAAA
jgi:hypothetical protein